MIPPGEAMGVEGTILVGAVGAPTVLLSCDDIRFRIRRIRRRRIKQQRLPR